ncbi:hypothetical protein B5X24_HaOG209931 [Helicoverpa armigera]|uniref:Uncharacterized protein n=1 Tax=Helicoverpa armigera TaxID=29058 RepID=A0A2W1BD87_HELAM|nr:hypothetical protein B5X24_HaOG209931 [Helicoverpa armigera]
MITYYTIICKKKIIDFFSKFFNIKLTFIAERCALRALRPLEHPASAAAVARRQAAAQLERQLASLHTEWTLFVARSGLVKFPSEPGQYGHALQLHKQKQRQVRRQLEMKLAALQAEVRQQLLVHRPWRCVEADFAEFPAPELAAVSIYTILYLRKQELKE